MNVIIDPNNPLLPPPNLSIESILQNHAQGLNHFKAHIEALIQKVSEINQRIEALRIEQERQSVQLELNSGMIYALTNRVVESTSHDKTCSCGNLVESIDPSVTICQRCHAEKWVEANTKK